jgi:hypothetical protein
MKIVDSNKLTIVERPTMAPGFCMASMAAEDSQGFIDTLLSPPLVDPRVYISVSWVEETARKLGMVHPDDDSDLRAEVELLREQLRERDEQLHAVEILESAGFAAKKKAATKRATKKAPAKKTTTKKDS